MRPAQFRQTTMRPQPFLHRQPHPDLHFTGYELPVFPFGDAVCEYAELYRTKDAKYVRLNQYALVFFWNLSANLISRNWGLTEEIKYKYSENPGINM